MDLSFLHFDVMLLQNNQIKRGASQKATLIDDESIVLVLLYCKHLTKVTTAPKPSCNKGDCFTKIEMLSFSFSAGFLEKQVLLCDSNLNCSDCDHN